MPIIKPKQKQEREQIRISLDKKLKEKIDNYCQWADVHKLDDFFEQAAEFVFSKDKDWLTIYNQCVEK